MAISSASMRGPSSTVISGLSLLVFTFLDILDSLLCPVFWTIDFIFDSDNTPCYCRHRRHGTIPLPSRTGNFNTSPPRESYGVDDDNAVSETGTKINDSVLRNPKESINGGNDVEFPEQRKTRNTYGGLFYREFRKRRLYRGFLGRSRDNVAKSRWSDCGCSTCTSWQSNEKQHLYVHVAHKDASSCYDITNIRHENVVFIHGFLSASSIWSEKVIPYLPKSQNVSYHLYAIDLLGFGKSPKPRNCHYTIDDQIHKIKESVIQKYKLEKFHIVAHSMGCLVALALAAEHSRFVKTITLVAPPYFVVPENESAASYVLRQVAPRKIWPLLTFGASVMSWYEHVGRGVCFLICKHHFLWERVMKILTLKRVSHTAIHDFMQHTHHSAWHIFHNVICGGTYLLDSYLTKLEMSECKMFVFHGKKDIVVPVQCSVHLQKRYHNVELQIIDSADHFTVIFGRELQFSNTIERIWGTA